MSDLFWQGMEYGAMSFGFLIGFLIFPVLIGLVIHWFRKPRATQPPALERE